MGTFVRKIAFGVVTVLSFATASHAALYGAQPDTGKIVEIDAVTGVILRSFSAPDPSFNLVGLSGAEGGAVLLWQDSSGATSGAQVTRIDPVSGSVLDFHTPLYSNQVRGLTAQNVGGVQYIVSAGDTPLIQHGYDSSQYDELRSGNGTVRALGGDDLGRSFAGCFYQNVWTIREFDPLSNTVLNSFSCPTATTGLAFDGSYLYAAANEVQGTSLVTRLYTLDPNSGATIHSATLQGSPLTELAVAVPEPEPALALLAMSLQIVFGKRRPNRAGKELRESLHLRAHGIVEDEPDSGGAGAI